MSFEAQIQFLLVLAFQIQSDSKNLKDQFVPVGDNITVSDN